MDYQTTPSDTDSNRLRELLKTLNMTQLRYVTARLDADTDKEAAEAIGITPNVVKSWRNKADVDEAARLMGSDGVITALEIRRRSLAEAMAVKRAGLQSENEAIQQRCATEIIEWELGKAVQPTQNEHNVHVNIDGLADVLNKAYGKTGS